MPVCGPRGLESWAQRSTWFAKFLQGLLPGQRCWAKFSSLGPLLETFRPNTSYNLVKFNKVYEPLTMMPFLLSFCVTVFCAQVFITCYMQIGNQVVFLKRIWYLRVPPAALCDHRIINKGRRF